MVKGRSTTVISIRLSDEVIIELKKEARGWSIGELIKRLILRHIYKVEE